MKVSVIPTVAGGYETIPNDLEKDWRNWKSEIEIRLYRPQHFWDQQEYWEKPWKLEKTCCHSVFSERPLVKTGLRNLLGVK